jgi:type VI secretion system secreted protein VgrG
MHHDQHVTMTLAIAEGPGDLQVIGINGHEQLNRPFCFDVDLVSPTPALNCRALLQRDASLTLDPGEPASNVIHGQIQAARRLCHGPDLSVYRLRLMPPVQRLADRARRHAWNGLTVLQIIERLLRDHRLAEDDFRFEHLIGEYPAREHCVQFDETDLHLLQRLCEEEGISFRFEHQARRHVLVFSDDPAGFPEWPVAEQVEHLAEQWSMRTCYSSHAAECDTPQGRHQVSVRSLERVRCERREIMGRSAHPWLRSGQVIRVDGHPDALFNDQWLLTEVRHRARQLAPLRNARAENIIQILQAMAADDIAATYGNGNHDPGHGFDQSRLHSYSNRFRVIPWAMPFRPSLAHPKPLVSDVLLATQTHAQADPGGRVRIRYDWQADRPEGGEDNWARVVSSAGIPEAGARVQVSFLEGDPDQPVICGGPADASQTTQLGLTLQVDGTSQAPVGPILQLRDDERLHIDSPITMSLHSTQARLCITESGVEGLLFQPETAVQEAQSPLSDLQLMHPTDNQQPLAHCTWYIVRMGTPDLGQLARLAPDDILFEGKTDAQGWLGLGPQDLVHLSQLQQRPDTPLWLVHPGHCRALHSVLRHI